jgi:hypothetical protein
MVVLLCRLEAFSVSKFLNAVIDRVSILINIKDIEQARKFINVLLEYI